MLNTTQVVRRMRCKLDVGRAPPQTEKRKHELNKRARLLSVDMRERLGAHTMASTAHTLNFYPE